MLLVFGVFLPLQNGIEWITSPILMAAWAWLPLILVAGVIADSFAGERERHTLETLLASRLSDESILLGKVVAAVVYGCGFTLLLAAVSLLSVNIAHWQGHFVMFPAMTAVGIPVLSLLSALAAAAAGVLLSLRAPTARQAAQMLSVVVMLLLFVPVFGFRALPADLRARIGEVIAGFNPITAVATTVGFLLLLDGVLLVLGLMRFRRARLILD